MRREPLPTPEGVFAEILLPERPRAVVQVVHGMAEHSGRYLRFAQALAGAGYAVALADHRGHGRSAGTRFHLADEDGWSQALRDLAAVTAAAQTAAGTPEVILLGHSFGSYLARAAVCAPGSPLVGAVISGPGGALTVPQRAALALARAGCRSRGPASPAWGLSDATYRSFNLGFGPRSRFEWLSRDRAAVDAYVADAGCGGTATYGFFRDMLTGIDEATQVQARWPALLPTLVVAGDRDPVGRKGRAARRLADDLRAGGCRDVTVRIYPGARHEPLQELNRDEVTRDVIEWLTLRW